MILLKAHPAISNCSHLLLKIKSGEKYKSLAKITFQGFQKLHIFKKVYFDQLLDFPILLLLFLHTLLLCHILLFEYWIFNTFRVSISLNPGPNCLQRLSADNKSHP